MFLFLLFNLTHASANKICWKYKMCLILKAERSSIPFGANWLKDSNGSTIYRGKDDYPSSSPLLPNICQQSRGVFLKSR